MRSSKCRDISMPNQLLSQCLQLTAQQPVALQLAGYSSDLCCDRAVLRNLPGDTLTYLHIDNVNDTTAKDVAVGLTALHHLSDLQIKGEGPTAIDQCMAPISHLSKLTRLLLHRVRNFDSQLLPVQLLDLDVKYGESPSDDELHHDDEAASEDVVADFTCLGQLQRLRFVTNYVSTDFTGVPPQLEVLDVDLGYGHSLVRSISNLTAATRLQKISIWYCGDVAADLRVLSTLPQLSYLQLSYVLVDTLRAAFEGLFPTQLPMLVNLGFREATVSPNALTSAVRSIVGVATGLTRLELQCDLESPQAEPPLALCGIVALLTELRGLSLRFDILGEGLEFVSGDVQLLTCLIKLTQLNLKRAGQFVCDDDVIVLAYHSKQLRSLTVPITSTAVLRTIDLCGSRGLVHLAIAELREQLPSYLFESRIKTVEFDSDSD